VPLTYKYGEAAKTKLKTLHLEELFDLPSLEYSTRQSPPFFGNVCYEPSSLGVFQSAPHVDSGNTLALLYYLSPHWEGAGGTAFYREKASQASRFRTDDCHVLKDLADAIYEIDSEEHHDQYSCYCRLSTCGDEGSCFHARVQQGYRSESDDGYELLLHVPFKFDRAIIYSAMQLHSGYLTKEDVDQLSCLPEKGRVTANVFIN
jgi:hypothetical protein